MCGGQVAPGMPTHARKLLGLVTWRCCSGHGRLDAHGMRRPAQQQLGVGTWRCCSGSGRPAAHGTHRHVRRRRWAGTCACCSIFTPMAALGTRTPAHGQLAVATSACCHGSGRRDAPGTRTSSAESNREASRGASLCLRRRVPLGPSHSGGSNWAGMYIEPPCCASSTSTTIGCCTRDRNAGAVCIATHLGILHQGHVQIRIICRQAQHSLQFL